jgi:glucosamine--fructose-6-phosphate aminotransferase (isomerizing)
MPGVVVSSHFNDNYAKIGIVFDARNEAGCGHFHCCAITACQLYISITREILHTFMHPCGKSNGLHFPKTLRSLTHNNEISCISEGVKIIPIKYQLRPSALGAIGVTLANWEFFVTLSTTDPRPDLGATLMFSEAAEAGAAVARFMQRNRGELDRLAAHLAQFPPAIVVTCARGSSDHAATYAKYLIETRTGLPTASAAFSTVSVYDAPVVHRVAGSVLCLAISQSGRSPDMLAMVERQQASGATVVALVNDEASPLAQMADFALPLHAGAERSVAATKSYITSLAGIAALVAAWVGDDGLIRDVEALPALLDASFAQDWTPLIHGLVDSSNLFIIARGYGLAVAQEAALKLKETSALHGEAFSAAEVRHGPMAVVREGFAVLAFAGDDATGDDVRQIAGEFAGRGAKVWLADTREQVPAGVCRLPALAVRDELSPLLMISSFYRMANALAQARGHNPDQPPYLAKVTRTR